MASEVEWRRKWKPGLAASPWQSLKVDDRTYLIKYCFSQDSYEILITDLTNFWYESISDAALKKRVKKLNPGIEAPLTRILDQIQSVVDKNQDGSEKSLKVAFKDDAEEGEQRMLLTISSHLAGMPFTWNFHCRPAEKTLASEHLIIPLLAMVGELTRRQKELIKIIQTKDKEIDDYKSQGVKASRKHIETQEFVETAFEMNMMTSKNFENQMRGQGLSAFDAKGQDLYRQVMCKKAWVNRSPGKGDTVEDSLLDDISNDGDRKPSTGPSWGTSRLPPSLVGSKSPNKSPSPTKSARSSKSVTPESSPVKDSELLRRQALERRLEQEETKKQEKNKKKKKIAF